MTLVNLLKTEILNPHVLDSLENPETRERIVNLFLQSITQLQSALDDSWRFHAQRVYVRLVGDLVKNSLLDIDHLVEPLFPTIGEASMRYALTHKDSLLVHYVFYKTRDVNYLSEDEFETFNTLYRSTPPLYIVSQTNAMPHLQIDKNIRELRAAQRNPKALPRTKVNTIDFKDIPGETPLIRAAKKGDIKSLRSLIKDKANLEIKDKFGYTALTFAATNGHTECVKALIETNANVNAANQTGRTALMGAAFYGHKDSVKALIEAQADVNIANQNGLTALILAATNGHTECIKALIEANANINATHQTGKTALMGAAFYGHKDSVKALIEAQADVNIANQNGVTALVLAAANGHAECIKTLIDANVSINATNQNGVTALTVAAANGHTDCIKALIDANAHVHLKNKAGQTAEKIARDKGYKEIAELLKKSASVKQEPEDQSLKRKTDAADQGNQDSPNKRAKYD